MQLDTLYNEGNIRVRRSVESDIDVISKNISPDNIEEIWVAHHLTPSIVIDMAVKESYLCFTIEEGNNPIGIFGIRNPEERKAEVFFLVTRSFNNIGRVFLRQARGFINNFLKIYPYLDGWVYAKNIKSIEWMRYCGATIEEPMQYGIEGKLFSHFFFV